jgi:hypothetical protein
LRQTWLVGLYVKLTKKHLVNSILMGFGVVDVVFGLVGLDFYKKGGVNLNKRNTLPFFNRNA